MGKRASCCDYKRLRSISASRSAAVSAILASMAWWQIASFLEEETQALSPVGSVWLGATTSCRMWGQHFYFESGSGFSAIRMKVFFRVQKMTNLGRADQCAGSDPAHYQILRRSTTEFVL